MRLRAERAALLGFANHAACVTADETAGTPGGRRRDARAARPSGRQERPRRAGRPRRDERDAGRRPRELESWDWAFYTEKVRQAKYDVDTAALRPWFEAERVLQDGVFCAATQLYGVTFTERPDLVALPPRRPRLRGDATTTAPASGSTCSTCTPATRKRGGAWMNPLISQNDLLQHPVVVVNNLNVPKPAAGRAHAADVRRGVDVLPRVRARAARPVRPRDLPEASRAPTCSATSSSSRARSTRCGCSGPRCSRTTPSTTRPASRLDAGGRRRGSARRETFNEGFATSEYLAAALLDQAWHTLTPDAAAAVDGRRRFRGGRPRRRSGSTTRRCPPATRAPTSRTSSRAATTPGYYSYIWSEVLDADTVEWFTRERRAHPRERRPVPVAAAGRRRLEGPARGVPRVPRSRRRDRAAAEAPRAELTGSSGDTTPPRPSRDDSAPTARWARCA